jgi:hypothetical protein
MVMFSSLPINLIGAWSFMDPPGRLPISNRYFRRYSLMVFLSSGTGAKLHIYAMLNSWPTDASDGIPITLQIG